MKKSDAIVSVIIPCYNMERWVGLGLDSLLIQDYPDVEVIAVNDGSTDATLQVLESYSEKFQEKGYTFKIITKKNVGRGANTQAIEFGLKIAEGVYFLIVDADDYLVTQHSLSKRVEFLENNPDFDIVYNPADMIDAENNFCVKETWRDTSGMPGENMFLRNILGINYHWNSNAYLVRFSAFDKVVANRDLEILGPGPNVQLRLPLFYQSKVGYIDEVLSAVVERSDSDSRQKRPFLNG